MATAGHVKSIRNGLKGENFVHPIIRNVEGRIHSSSANGDVRHDIERVFVCPSHVKPHYSSRKSILGDEMARKSRLHSSLRGSRGQHPGLSTLVLIPSIVGGLLISPQLRRSRGASQETRTASSNKSS